MDAPHKGDAVAVQESRHGDIGLDHEHLDDGMRVACIDGFEVLNPAGMIEADVTLGHIQLEYAGTATAFFDQTSELLHFAQQRD